MITILAQLNSLSECFSPTLKWKPHTLKIGGFHKKSYQTREMQLDILNLQPH